MMCEMQRDFPSAGTSINADVADSWLNRDKAIEEILLVNKNRHHSAVRPDKSNIQILQLV